MDSNIGRKDLDLQDDVGLKDRLLGITTEVGGGVATDWATSGLLFGGPAGWAAYGLINFGQGAYTNYLVQKHLYGEDNIKWGEVWASGGMGMIPFSQIPVGAKAAKYLGAADSVKRGLVGGATMGLAGEQLRVGIDEQRLLNPLEASVAAGIGGGLGGGLAAASPGLKNRLIEKTSEYLSDRPYSRLWGPARRFDLLEPELQGSVGAMNIKKFSNIDPDDPNTYTFKNLPRDTGDNYKEFIAPQDSPQFRNLPTDQQARLSRFARGRLQKTDWEDLGFAQKYEATGEFDQGDWNKYVQAVKKNEDDVYALIKILNKIETDKQIKKSDLSGDDVKELGRRMADLFINEDHDRALEAFRASDLQKIIDNEGGIIEFSTDRMRREGSLPYVIRNISDLAAAVRRRLDEIAQDPYYEFGHQKASLNVLLDNNAANRANYMRNAMPEEARSIIETRFEGNDLDDLLENGFEGVVIQPGNRSTQAAQDLDPNINKLYGTAEDVEESFLNFMRPQYDIANEFPVNIRQNIIDDYMEELGVIKDDLAQYGVDVDNSTFDFSNLNRSKFKEVLHKYRTGNVPLYRILEIEETRRLFTEFPELAEEFLTVRPGTSGNYAINYLSNLNLTNQQRALLNSLKKKIDKLGTPDVIRPKRSIKKKVTEGGKYNLDGRKKIKKKFNKKDDEDPPVVRSKRK